MRQLLVFGIVLGIVAGFAAAALPRDYDFRLFTYDEANKLRQVKLLDRMKTYDRVLDRYGYQLQHFAQMRNYKEMGDWAAMLDGVMDYILEDIRLCVADEKLRNNKQLRKSEIALRSKGSLIRGLQRSVPLVWQEKFDPALRKMTYGRRLLFNFINHVDQEE